MEKDKKKFSKKVYFVLVPIAILIIAVIVLISIVIHRSVENNKNISMPWSTREHNSSSGLYTGKKPIIYIYPTKKTEVEVRLGNSNLLSCTYPKYNGGWKVIASPDGSLVDKNTGRNLYALYWEGESMPKTINMQEGFCVKGEDTAKFLEEKLSILGLSEREAEEFIVYWLPKMEDNNFNYIRFETIEEQNKAMPLEVTPKPDNVIRVMMDWKGLDASIEVQEQTLETPSRDGYTVVEWGGSELN